MKKDTLWLLAGLAAGALYLAKRKRPAASSAASSPLTATAQETAVARPALAPSRAAEEAEAETGYIDMIDIPEYAVIDAIPAYSWGVTNWGGWGGRRHRRHGGGGGHGGGRRGGRGR